MLMKACCREGYGNLAQLLKEHLQSSVSRETEKPGQALEVESDGAVATQLQAAIVYATQEEVQEKVRATDVHSICLPALRSRKKRMRNRSSVVHERYKGKRAMRHSEYGHRLLFVFSLL